MRTLDARVLADRLERAWRSLLPAEKGFLPAFTPELSLPAAFERYELACEALPERFGAPNGSVRPWLDELFAEYDPEVVDAIHDLSLMEKQRAMTVLSTLAHSYRWERTPPDRAAFAATSLTLPPGIDQCWHHLARALHQPRVGSLWNMALCNWALASKRGASDYSVDELTLENMRLAVGWLHPPLDRFLEIFILTFVESEARGVAVTRRGIDLVRAVSDTDAHAVGNALEALEDAIKTMNHVFYKNIRGALIDPAIWNSSIKPIYGWGVDAGDGVLEGASGMQLGAIQCADAVLGVADRSFMARAALGARRYMPQPHRQFLSVVDTVRPLVPAFVRESGDPSLARRYNACIDALRAWRRAHRQRGALYLRGDGSGPMGGTTGLAVSSNHHAALDDFQAKMQERIDETTGARMTVG